MERDQQIVRITADDVSAAIPLAEPMPERIRSRQVTKLDVMEKEPSRFGRMFKAGRGGGISVTLDPFPVPGGAFEWATQTRFPPAA